MLLSKNMIGLLSFTCLQRGKIAEPFGEKLPIEHHVPKPMFLFGKEINIEKSLHKWEENLTTNTLTDYDEQVSKQAMRISAKNSTKPIVAQTPMAAASNTSS